MLNLCLEVAKEREGGSRCCICFEKKTFREISGPDLRAHDEVGLRVPGAEGLSTPPFVFVCCSLGFLASGWCNWDGACSCFTRLSLVKAG